ncbi:MAG: DegV family protein [Chloroflexi bacterium]|nr:DegV family protein [Chloroflexota bacterium]
MSVVVRIVTDSTADIPSQVAKELGIVVVPLSIHFGDRALRDGIDISPEEFYGRLVAAQRLPTTSQPSAGAMLEVYHQLLPKADAILSVHISAKLSGTYNSACQAQQMLGQADRLHVVDSGKASMALGLVVMAAARAAREGAGVQDVLAVVQEAMEETDLYFLLDTLEYLEKGGRIGKAQAFLGSLLSIKPLLGLKEGEIHPLERPRSRKKGLDRLVELARERAPLREAAVMHTTTPADAEMLAGRLAALVPRGKLVVTQVGGVIGTHVGPGAIGIALRRATTS